MQPLSRIEMPSRAQALLTRLAEVSVGESLFSDRADSVSYLFSHGAPLGAGTPQGVRRYATFVLGAASVLKDGWSILPPGVAGDDAVSFPPLPSPAQWRAAVGEEEAARWMALSVWTAAEYTAQRALPLPRIVGLDDEGYQVASERWHALGSHVLAPALGAYPDQGYALAVPDTLKRAADSLARTGAGAAGPGSALWQLNRENRLALVRHMASRDAALVANTFALEDGHADMPGSSILYAPDHLPPASRRQQLHPSALGIFAISEWPLPADVLAGSELIAARGALRRNALAFAADRPHLRDFLLKSNLLTPGAWTHSNLSWELASVVLCAPDDPPPERTTQDPRVFARAVAKRFTAPGREPSEYLRFRDNALAFCGPTNDLAHRLLSADAAVMSEWSDEARWARMFLEGCGDSPERAATQARLSALDEAASSIAKPGHTLPIVHAALRNAAHDGNGDRIVQLAENLASISPGPERDQATRAVLDALRDASGLSPTAIGNLSRSVIIAPSDALGARLRRRVCGPREDTAAIFGLNTSPTEENALDQVCADLKATKGVYYVEHRMLSILEAGTRAGLSPDPALFDILCRYNPGESIKGREKELRALFALIAAFDHERSDAPESGESLVLSAITASSSLREARHTLSVSGQLSSEERILTLLTQATGRSRSAFSAGVANADPVTVGALQDAHTARICIASVPDQGVRQRATDTLHTALRAYAGGSFQEWKYSHPLADAQIGFASKKVQGLWKDDRAWNGEALGVRLIVRESSDFGELLRHGDFPVKTCHALLGYGDRLGSGLSTLADAHAKLLQFVDPNTQRIVGRSVVRMFRREKNGKPLILAEAPYASTGSREAMAMRLLAASCLGEKFSGTGVLVTQGVCAPDRQSDILPEAERHMGRMKLVEAVLPPAMVSAHYLDSNIAISNSAEVPESGVVELACHPEAVELLRDSVTLRPLPDTLCRKDPPSLLSSIKVEDDEYAARCRAVFPDHAERAAFFEANPGVHLSGTIPRGYEREWRESIKRFPALGTYLHHSEAVQSLLGGAPDPAGDGADARGALAVIEGRPYFRGLIHGMARDEIAAARTLWLSEVGNAMKSEPGRWPPEIDYLAIGCGVKDRMAPVATRHHAFDTPSARTSRPVRPAPTPGADPLAPSSILEV